ncbi:MAG: hypothetical protein CO150_06565 [Nitrospirae bacterium CG_4_9_14_3_um_filter_53_35]|nr:MAG: hypothetical protein AUK29_02015 [Nitrospirae bacterium CG2_30_53_67]PIS36949.1 MAG: hypothetical protein COT35_08450 [Nitrospirae bacterium CG08_land_8_20_14_0_20_52_24]PIX85058.1 MAG: hypothetical protein COZ32_10480 [Nitrospirae bacterium CG_4_10_14_3_um_filter_53_41]PJA74466.1 MAG: hypothetical protein CO150_06565 [Nitrospirae bacterium CG_4_9_14_3_um_filter_53_35]
MSEKRRVARKISRTRIRFGQGRCDKTAFTSNLSVNGFFIRTNRPFAPGTLLEFEIDHPNGHVIRLEGQVVHASRTLASISRVRRSGMGIELLEKPEEYLDYLKNLRKTTIREEPEDPS